MRTGTCIRSLPPATRRLVRIYPRVPQGTAAPPTPPPPAPRCHPRRQRARRSRRALVRRNAIRSRPPPPAPASSLPRVSSRCLLSCCPPLGAPRFHRRTRMALTAERPGFTHRLQLSHHERRDGVPDGGVTSGRLNTIYQRCHQHRRHRFLRGSVSRHFTSPPLAARHSARRCSIHALAPPCAYVGIASYSPTTSAAMASQTAARLAGKSP